MTRHCLHMCILTFSICTPTHPHTHTQFQIVPGRGVYPGTPTPQGYPAQSPVQAAPTTPTMVQAPPPYGQPPNTPTDSGYFGSVPSVHQTAVPSPLSNRGVSYNVCADTCFSKVSICFCMFFVLCVQDTLSNFWAVF